MAATTEMSPRNNNNKSVSNQLRGPTKPAVVVSSPWTQIVRGESEAAGMVSVPLLASSSCSMAPPQPSAAVMAAATEQVVAEDEGLEHGGGNAGKKPAWNKPSNGSGTAAAAEVGPVMGAHSWPALSETTKTSSTKSPSDSLKALADGLSSAVSQATGTTSSMSQKQVGNNGSPNLNQTPNHTAPTRQKFPRRNAASTSSNGGLPHPSAPQGPVTEMPHNPTPRDHTQKSGYVSQAHGGNDHPQQHSSFRNRNGSSHPRGDGYHHHSYGGKRNQDRGHQDWNHRNFNGRDAHMQPHRAVQRYIRHAPPPPPPPPPGSAPYMSPGPLRHFPSNIGFPEFAAVYYVPDPLRVPGVPFIGPSHHQTLVFPAPDPQLHAKIVNQIDYYFSNENLIKDTYLRQNMDDQGWVPIKLIAGFNKVSLLTDNIQLILDALRSSTVLEVQGDKIRKRNDWMRWLIPHVNQVDAQAEAMSRSSSGDLSNQFQRSLSMGTGQVSIQGGSDLSGKITS